MQKAGSAALANNDTGNTRDLIMNTAISYFAEHGFSGTSLRDIGEEAGINFQSIRYHFGSKEELWEAVVATLSQRAVDAGKHHEQAIVALPLRDQLKAQIRALVAYTVENPELWIILTREAMKNSERYRQIYPKYVERLYQLTEKFLSRLQKGGVINSEIPVKDLVMIFLGGLNYRIFTPADSEFYLGKSLTTDDVIKKHSEALFLILSNAGDKK